MTYICPQMCQDIINLRIGVVRVLILHQILLRFFEKSETELLVHVKSIHVSLRLRTRKTLMLWYRYGLVLSRYM